MIDCLQIQGGNIINGEIKVSGAKNSSLPLIIAALLTKEKCRFTNVPELEDIPILLKLLRYFGARVTFKNGVVETTTPEILQYESPFNLVKPLRASFWVLGPILARCGKSSVALPGGDAIGSRPVDLHIKGLIKLGAEVSLKNGYVFAECPNGLRPAEISLPFPSVGATHQLLMTASLIPGRTVIRGVAKEPEVVQLAECLTMMGAKVEGAGTDEIIIYGQEELSGAQVEVVGDRIEATTYLCAAAMTAGKVKVSGINPKYLDSTLEVLAQAGCIIKTEETSITLYAPERLKAVDFETAPYPGVATDNQPCLMAALCTAEGVSKIKETIFEDRFGHIREFRKFGVKIRFEGQVAICEGTKNLSGASVEGTDIRAAAAMVLLALAAPGVSYISETMHIYRGYENFIGKLQSLGATISSIPDLNSDLAAIGC